MQLSKNQRLIFIALLAAQAVVLSLIEQAIPTPFTIAPGAKLGLANVITVIALYKLNVKDTITIIILRLLLAGFLGGTLSTLLFSTAGAALSFIGMLLAKQLGSRWISPIGLSVIGATLHNFGQLSIASFVAGTWTVLVYLPFLTFFGILSGVATGALAFYLLNHLNKLPFMKEEI